MRIHLTEMKSGIRPSPEFAKKGLASFAINVGLKCDLDCVYCSSGSLLRCHPAFKQAGESPYDTDFTILSPNMPELVARDASAMKHRGLVQLCTTVDAWAPGAQQYQLGRRCAEALLAQPGWALRVLSKNAAITQDFDLFALHRSRVLVGLSLTAALSNSHIVRVTEPNASTIEQRMEAMRIAHQMQLETYIMFCPLLPEIADREEDLSQMVDFSLSCGVKEIFIEPVNARGPGLVATQRALDNAGFVNEARAIEAIRKHANWSEYAIKLLEISQRILAARGALDKLRFLLYAHNLLPHHLAWVMQNNQGVKLL